MPIARNTAEWETEDPEYAAFFKANPALAGLLDGDYNQMRAAIDGLAPPGLIPQEEGLEIKATKVNGVPAVLYQPSAASATKRPAAVVFHGGGFVIGNPTQEHPTSIAFAKAGAVVVSVDYRLAPEHVFPAAVEDAYAAFDWLIANADTYNVDVSKITVYGSSAGGQLAAVVAQYARDKGVKLAGQLLRVPWVVFTSVFPKEYPNESYEKFTETPILTKGSMIKFSDYYVKANADPTDPRLSPLLGNLKGLAPAYLEIAGLDPLRDDGLAYAEALTKAGVPVEYNLYNGVPHAFNILPLTQGLKAQVNLEAAFKKFVGA